MSRQRSLAAPPSPTRLPAIARGSPSRSLVAGGLAIAATVLLAQFLDGVKPLGSWLVWDLARIWGWQLLLSAAWTSVGHLLLARVLRVGGLPVLERWLLAACSGLVIFAIGMYLGGFLGIYGRSFAVGWPVALLALGARGWWRQLRQLLFSLRSLRRGGLLVTAASGYGVVCLGLLYLGLLSPDAINYDASWMHVTIAQDYAREGRIIAFPGDWVKNVPHLASLLYTWGFLVPGFDQPAHRWMMALHTELAAFLWTLLGVAATVRWMLGGRPIRAAWVALFLFPGIFVYDSNLGGAADHVAALFAPPLFLTTARLLTLPPAASGSRAQVGRWLLLGLLAGGAILTKLQTTYLLAPLALLLAIGLGRRLWSPAPQLPRLALLLGPLGAAVCTLLVVSLHFGKNWLQYGNPFYPFMQDSFVSHPGLPDAATQVTHLLADLSSKAPQQLGARVQSALALLVSFAFTPHYSFVNGLPVFGPLFTLCLLLLPVGKMGRRVWLAVAAALGALFMWSATYRVDRNLQVFMPLLAAVTGAVLLKIWRLGGVARVGISLLVGLQLCWGGDLMFSGHDRLGSALALIKAGFDRRAAEHLAGYRRSYVELGRVLPADAVVVLHAMHSSLGLDRRVLLDWMGFQGQIDYRSFGSPRDLYDRFRALGVTHIVVGGGTAAAPTKQEDVIFAAFRAQHAQPVGQFGGLQLLAMPDRPPPRVASTQVLVLGLGGYADGVYDVRDLSICEAYPEHLRTYPAPRRALSSADNPAADLDSVQAAVIGSGFALDAGLAERLQRELPRVAEPSGLSVYVRPSP